MNRQRKHYWLRDGFESLAKNWTSLGFPVLGRRDVTLEYPKTTDQAVAELTLRGISVHRDMIEYMLTQNNTCVDELHELLPESQAAQWHQHHIDALAEWFDSREFWTPDAQLCALLNLSYDQFIRAYLVALARFGEGKPFVPTFDASRFVLVATPPADEEDYARVRFHPQGEAIREIRL